jgi:hypothetical protein
MTTSLAEGRVYLGQEARRFGVVPEPGDLPPPPGSTSTQGEPVFGPFAAGLGAIDLESLAARLGPVLEG